MGYFCPNCGEIHETTACPSRGVATRPVRTVPVAVNARVSPPLCTFCGGVVEQKCDCMTKPDRAARIRALAEKLAVEDALRDEYGTSEDYWNRARYLLDGLDRLEREEREEREKERDHG